MTITIVRYAELPNRDEIALELDAIFFQSSNTKAFANDNVRAEFRERWLGRYLAHYRDWFYVAMADGKVAGYLAGCLDDPAGRALFDDIALYKSFAHLTAQYPAHLHVNLSEEFRSAGAGSALVRRFCDDARDAGSPGVHVMTGKHARNVGFYARSGFLELGSTGADASAVVFLGREL